VTVEELLARARARLERLDPQAASQAIASGDALLIDIRAESQRAADGVVPGARFIPRNVLEWRCDPASEWHDDEIAAGLRIILMCDEGYQSSLAAATLRDLGVDATDLAGGFQAWRAAGLPTEHMPLVREKPQVG
jgi:rhodanese-related sulfurtransferase